MSPNLPPPTEVGGGLKICILKKIHITFGVVLLCAISSILINLFVFVYIGQGASGDNIHIGNISQWEGGKIIGYLPFILFGPMLETLIFLFVWLIAKKISDRPLIYSTFFVSSMTLLSWVLHGANWMAVSRGFGFFILSLLYQNYAKKESVKSAFWTTAFAHCFWNADVLLIISAIRIIS